MPDDPAKVRAADIVDWVVRHSSDSADAISFGGNGFRAASAIDELERRTGRLVLSKNQVLLWALLAAGGSPVRVTPNGRLLPEQAPPDV